MSVARVIWAALLGVGVAAFTLLFGIEPVFALAWGLLAAAVIVALGFTANPQPTVWHAHLRDTEGRRASEVSRLAWSINARSGMARPFVTGRVRTLLASVLERRGLDLSNPGDEALIDALIGAGTVATFSGRDASIADLDRIVRTITHLQADTEDSR